MNLFDEFFAIVSEFRKTEIVYSVVGGIAMAFHDQPRFTRDIDFLVLPEKVDEIERALKRIGYFESSPPWTFEGTKLTLHRFMKTDKDDFLTIDMLYGDEPKYREIVANALAEESSEGIVMVARKNDLIWMKRKRGSDQDRVDIGKLENDENRENTESSQ